MLCHTRPNIRLVSSFIALISITWISACGGGGGAASTPPPPVQDTTPNAFAFTAVTGEARNSIVESESVPISGISAAANASIEGGEYSINGGAYGSAAGSISNGQSVQVRLTSSGAFDTEVSATLTIGGVAGTFSARTLLAPAVLIDVNANIGHTVNGFTDFDRTKFITIHADAADHDWFGNNAQSLNEPNALPDLMQDFLAGKDVYLGRNTGGITWNLGEMDEDPNRLGFVDENDATATGNSVRSNYSNNMSARWVSTRLHDDREVDMIVGAQQHPFWPDGTTTRQGWALSQADTPAEPFGTASGHWMSEYMLKFFRPRFSSDEGADRPLLVEVMNEPVYDLVDYPTFLGPPAVVEPLDKIFEYHNAVAAEIRATNSDVRIGGYTAAFPNFEENNFDRWRNRHKRFLDLAGDNMDFLSIHLYDFAAINRSSVVHSEYRKGSNVEATFDMLDQYGTLLFGSPKSIVISEYGGRAHTLENDPWSPERDWVMLKSMNSLLMAFLERPDSIIKTIPFVVLKAEWGRKSSTVPYPWRLMRQRFEASGETGNDWVYTELVKFYELWSDVNGTRVDSYATDPDVLVDAYVDGTDLYVIVNNLEFDDTTFNLDVSGIGDILSVDIRHLSANNDVPVLDTTTLAEVPESIVLAGEATMILRLEVDTVPGINDTSSERKHFATGMLEEIATNTTMSFDVDGLSLGTNGEAILRLGIGRAHGLSLTPNVTINGTPLTVPTDYRGYNQVHNGAGRADFFGVLEIPVPWSAIASDNQVDVTFSDSGGHVSSVALQVFNQTTAITRRTN